MRSAGEQTTRSESCPTEQRSVMASKTSSLLDWWIPPPLGWCPPLPHITMLWVRGEKPVCVSATPRSSDRVFSWPRNLQLYIPSVLNLHMHILQTTFSCSMSSLHSVETPHYVCKRISSCLPALKRAEKESQMIRIYKKRRVKTELTFNLNTFPPQQQKTENCNEKSVCRNYCGVNTQYDTSNELN